MPPPRAEYGPGSQYHQQRRKLAQHAIRCFELAIQTLGLPPSVLDVGCAEGAVVGWCRTHRITAVGVDLAVPAADPGWGLLHHDLAEPLDIGQHFAWVLCWEVAEHLEAAAAGVLCDTLARHLASPQGRLLFTAAPPGQRGPGHINCQPPEYWRALLQERGLAWLPQPSATLAAMWASNVPQAPWYGRNLQVFGWA